MDRRPSIVSVSSLGSLSGLLKPASLHALPESSSQPQLQNGSSTPVARKLSVNGKFDITFDVNNEDWDPDELFTKHTVGEVKLIQQRLRSDADAKQEELRLMVGERYRDLLQASTSIISISDSSKRVASTLGDMQRTALSVESVRSPKASLSGQGDSQLHMLQSLAAHMKLLLDAPEHLWRLLERKLYLYAAWLFLLSRVVHRSLSRDHDEDDAPWTASGIDIGEQFPLVQRQWDAVSQFRSQITQKATASLRESGTTSIEVCATLLTLHLLESRPLPETLSTFLSQRSRTLTSVLSDASDSLSNGSTATSSKSGANGVPLRSRKVIVREVRQKLKAVLDVVSRTLGTARTIFIEIQGKHSSLMGDVLEHIQTDDSHTVADLPADLRLTTQSLLSSLPSANHFLLLPVNIRTYKPYVDGASLSSQETSTQLNRRLDDWFQKALQQVQHALKNWFADLQSVREIWQVRKWFDTWIRNADGLREEERVRLGGVLDAACKQRAIAVWNASLDATVTAFTTRLENCLSQLDTSDVDIRPVQYLFRPPPLPTIQNSSLSATKTSFQRFKSALQSQIVCRTPLLDEVLSTVEDGIRYLHDDMDVVRDIKGVSSSLVVDLRTQYRRDTVGLCNSISEGLVTTLGSLSDSTEVALRRIMFIGRIANELSTSATVFDNLDCEPVTLDDFRTKLKQTRGKAMSQRREWNIAGALEGYRSAISKTSTTDESAPHPSPALINSLLSLADSLQAASSLDDIMQREWASEMLQEFAARLLDEQLIPGCHTLQHVWDVAFLLQVVGSWAPAMEDTNAALRTRLSEMLNQVEGSTNVSLESRTDTDLSDCLSRLQHLLGMLLPASYSSQMSQEKSSSLLQLGLPSSSSQSLPTLQLVKPSARFGLLLVGSSYVR